MTESAKNKKSSRTPGNTGTPVLDDAAVVEFLQAHPDFLVRHPEILDGLEPPTRWSGDGVVDMQHFMVGRLRSEMTALRESARDLITTSRNNLSTQTVTHEAVIGLLEATHFEEGVRLIVEELPLLLDVDISVIGFEAVANGPGAFALPDVISFEPGLVQRIIPDGKQVRLFDEIKDDGTLFGAAAATVRSAAVARLEVDFATPLGILALGSRTPGAFHPGQGSELFQFLARVVERCVRRWLDNPG